MLNFTDTLYNVYCDKCGKLKSGIFAGNPEYVLCKCNAPQLFSHEDKIVLLERFHEWLTRKGFIINTTYLSTYFTIDEFLKEQRRK